MGTQTEKVPTTLVKDIQGHQKLYLLRYIPRRRIRTPHSDVVEKNLVRLYGIMKKESHWRATPNISGVLVYPDIRELTCQVFDFN